MEFIIDKIKLMNCLNIVKTAVPTKTTNPILKNIFIEATEDEIVFRGTNTILFIEVKTTCDVKSPGKCCLDNLVVDVLSNFADDDIKVKMGDKKLTISQGKRRHSPVFMDAEEYPEKRKIKDYQQFNVKDFVKGIQKTSIATSNLAAHMPILQGFHINPHDKYLITSNGNQVALWEDFEVPGNICTPHGKVLMSVLSLFNTLSEDDKFEMSLGNWSGFRGEKEDLKWEVQMNGLNGEFPTIAKDAVQKAKEAQPSLEIKVEKGVLSNVLSICKLYADKAFLEGKSNKTVVSLRDDKVLFSMNIPDLVEMEEILECEYEEQKYIDGDFVIWIDSRLLFDVLSVTESDNVTIKFFDKKLPFIVLDEDVSNWTYLQVPMVGDKE